MRVPAPPPIYGTTDAVASEVIADGIATKIATKILLLRAPEAKRDRHDQGGANA